MSCQPKETADWWIEVELNGAKNESSRTEDSWGTCTVSRVDEMGGGVSEQTLSADVIGGFESVVSVELSGGPGSVVSETGAAS